MHPLERPLTHFRPVDAARYLSVSRQRINTLIRQGRLGRQVGRYTIISKAELDRYKLERERRWRGQTVSERDESAEHRVAS